MASSSPDWALYRSFLTVLREGSLSAAARVLGATQPTLGRHIETLEGSLGFPLFTRAPGGLTPTPMALALRPHAETMEAAAAALLRQASGEGNEMRGTVRLTASEMFGGAIVPPMLSRFLTLYPDILLELVLNNGLDDVLRREADIAIRMVAPVQDALLVRPLGRVTIGLYAHRDYVARHGLPQDIDALRAHRIIGFDLNAIALRHLGERGSFITRDLFKFRCDNDLAQMAALLAGIGICGCQDPLAARYPELLPVLPDQVRFDWGVWLVMHEDQRLNRRVKLLYDFLAEEISGYLAGNAPACRVPAE